MNPDHPIVDLSELPLDSLMDLDNTPFDNAVRQALAEAAEPRKSLGAFNSVVDN